MTRRRITQTIEIERRPEEVFAFVDAHTDDAAWRTGFVSIAKTTSGPTGVGTEYRETVKSFGRRVEATVRVTERRIGRSLIYDVTAGTSAFSVAYLFEPVGSGTRLTRQIEADFGPVGLVARLVAALLGRSLANDLPALRELLEAGETTRIAAKPRSASSAFGWFNRGRKGGCLPPARTR
jgi:carbon monoxide dehydrogenase subunit G